MIFCNEVKGKSMLALSRDLGVQYKTAFVLAHKIRESIGSSIQAEGELSGEVEVHGAYFGGYSKQENRRADHRDRRIERTGKRKVVVIIRERNGRAVPVIVDRESAAVPTIRAGRFRFHRPCRRVAGLECSAWLLRYAPGQP